jgi:hypothetical protein
MDNKDKLISRQVALKGAVELAKDSDNISEILATAEIIQNWILSPFNNKETVVSTPVAEKKPSPPIQSDTRSPVGQGEYVCPCPSKVYDNRLDKKSDKSPNFKCGNKQCTAGSNGFPYASWSDEPPAEIMVGFVAPDLVQPKSLDNITEKEAPF